MNQYLEELERDLSTRWYEERPHINDLRAHMKGDTVTELMGAAACGYERACQLLLAARADPNMKSAKGITALHYAIQYAHPEVVLTLIEHGAHLRERDDDGYTPLELTLVRLWHPIDAKESTAIVDMLTRRPNLLANCRDAQLAFRRCFSKQHRGANLSPDMVRLIERAIWATRRNSVWEHCDL